MPGSMPEAREVVRGLGIQGQEVQLAVHHGGELSVLYALGGVGFQDLDGSREPPRPVVDDSEPQTIGPIVNADLRISAVRSVRERLGISTESRSHMQHQRIIT